MKCGGGREYIDVIGKYIEYIDVIGKYIEVIGKYI